MNAQPARIDAHLHFWRPDCGFDNKPVADHAAYRRNFLPADVEPALDACGIDAVILVQTCPQAEETAWMLALARAHPRIAGITGWVDLDDPALDLAPLLAQPLLVGVRAQLRRVADARFVLRPTVLRNLARALESGLAVTLLAEARHYGFACEALAQLPAGPVTFNHLGMRFPDVDATAWRALLGAVAARPHTYVQLSGLPFLYAGAWRTPAARRVLDEALDALGPQRLLFASDWPMLLRFATYGEWVGSVEQLLDARGAGAGDRDAIFRANTLRANPRLRLPAAPAPAGASPSPSHPEHAA
jgi:L-fuconolactonase